MLKKPGFLAVTALYLTAAGKVCDAKDPDRNELLCGAGQVVPRARAIELGLIAPDEDEFTPEEDAFEGAGLEALEAENAALKEQLASVVAENDALKEQLTKKTAEPKPAPKPRTTKAKAEESTPATADEPSGDGE